MTASLPRAARITAALLRRWPLPVPPADGDKEDRGRLLVLAAAPDVPGAGMLAGIAGLRAGAGKLCIASAPAAVTAIATLVPESRVVPCTARALASLWRDRFDAMVIGPGMRPSARVAAIVRAAHAAHDASLVLDAGALVALRKGPLARGGTVRCVITPHAGEMAKLSGYTREVVTARAPEIACAAASRWRVVVVLKGATTFVADPDGHLWKHEGGSIALATSGSGDTLAGIVGGLLARGATPAQAAIHGVSLHAQAGRRAARRTGHLGPLAREFADEIPALLGAG